MMTDAKRAAYWHAGPVVNTLEIHVGILQQYQNEGKQAEAAGILNHMLVELITLEALLGPMPAPMTQGLEWIFDRMNIVFRKYQSMTKEINAEMGEDNGKHAETKSI